jgi:hypothetical protein
MSQPYALKIDTLFHPLQRDCRMTLLDALGVLLVIGAIMKVAEILRIKGSFVKTVQASGSSAALNATAGAGEVATASLWNCRSKTLPRSDKRAMAKARVSYAW